MSVPIAAVTSGILIFVGVIIVLFLAVAYGVSTYRGSAINAHPNDGMDDAPGSEAPSQPGGPGRVTEDRDDGSGARDGFSSHGTR